MENTSPIVVYLREIREFDKQVLGITTRIDEMQRDGRISVNTCTRWHKYIAKVYNKVIDKITARYHKMRNKERDLEYQARGY